jgi:hypothetical protein
LLALQGDCIFGNARQKEILNRCKSEGEEKTRESLSSDSILPDDRRLMEWWLHNIDVKINSSLQKKNTLI